MNDQNISPATSARVVYVGTGRRQRAGVFRHIGIYESERTWRQRLAHEMDDACREMARHGLCLVAVVPTLSTATWQGSWTEGAWLYFATAPAQPLPVFRGRPE